VKNNRIDVVDFSASGRSQFLAQLEASIEEMLHTQPLDQVETDEQLSIPEQLPGEDITTIVKEEEPEEAPVATSIPETTKETMAPSQIQQMEQVMQNGMSFLSGIYQMATGKSLAPEDQKISIDPETGEVVMRFKMKW